MDNGVDGAAVAAAAPGRASAKETGRAVGWGCGATDDEGGGSGSSAEEGEEEKEEEEEAEDDGSYSTDYMVATGSGMGNELHQRCWRSCWSAALRGLTSRHCQWSAVEFSGASH